MMPDDAQELPFPLSGVDVSCEVDRQTPRTTPRGVNVRARDPRTLRLRGGSRAGLSKLADATVSGLAGFPVQHLNVIVDPTVDALLANFPDVMSPPGNSIPDPSTNNAAGGSTDPDDPLVRNPDRTVRDGGSGIQPNRHKPDAQAGIQYVREAEGSAQATAPLVAAAVFGTTPPSGRLLVVFVWHNYVDSADFTKTVNVENGTGSAYTQVGAYVTATGGSGTEIPGTSKSYRFDSNVGGAVISTANVCTPGSGVVTWQDDIGFGADFTAPAGGFSLGIAEAAAVGRYGPASGFGVGSYYSNFVTTTGGGCISFGPSQTRLSMWYRVSGGVAADATARATVAGTTTSGNIKVALLEYSGAAALPLTNTANNSTLTPTTATPAAGSVPLNGGTGQAVVAAFLTNYVLGGSPTWAAGTGYNTRVGAGASAAPVIDRLGLSGLAAQTPTLAGVSPDVLDAGICAAFKKA